MVDAQDDVRPPSLMTLIPPEPPVDIVQSAVFLPISSISVQHKGRKIRTSGQYVSLNRLTPALRLRPPV